MPRFGVFSVIGLAGFAFQTAMLALLTRSIGWHYAVAVPIAAEATLLLNFVCHTLWTWADRPVRGVRATSLRLARYQLAKTLAIVASYLLTLALVSRFRLAPELANALSVGATALLNFVVADRLIFRPS
jgi:putative flippase GtrA